MRSCPSLLFYLGCAPALAAQQPDQLDVPLPLVAAERNEIQGRWLRRALHEPPQRRGQILSRMAELGGLSATKRLDLREALPLLQWGNLRLAVQIHVESCSELGVQAAAAEHRQLIAELRRILGTVPPTRGGPLPPPGPCGPQLRRAAVHGRGMQRPDKRQWLGSLITEAQGSLEGLGADCPTGKLLAELQAARRPTPLRLRVVLNLLARRARAAPGLLRSLAQRLEGAPRLPSAPGSRQGYPVPARRRAAILNPGEYVFMARTLTRLQHPRRVSLHTLGILLAWGSEEDRRRAVLALRDRPEGLGAAQGVLVWLLRSRPLSALLSREAWITLALRAEADPATEVLYRNCRWVDDEGVRALLAQQRARFVPR